MEPFTFLPKYPDIDMDRNDIYNMYNGDSFNQVIFGKKEFNELKLESKQPSAPENGTHYNHQRIIARFLASYTLYNELFLFHAPGTGKCHARGQKVMLATGQCKAIENVQVGDRLMGDDNSQRTVLSLATGTGPIYDIEFPETGQSYSANEFHILVLHVRPCYLVSEFNDGSCLLEWFSGNKLQSYLFTSDQKYRLQLVLSHHIRDAQNTIEISVADYLCLPSRIKKLLFGYSIPVEFSSKSVVIDPYIFGLWLNSSDPTQIQCLCSSVVSHVSAEFAFVYSLRLDESTSTFHIETDIFTDYSNTSIPNAFKFNSRNRRLALLAGLFDGNGYVSRNPDSHKAELVFVGFERGSLKTDMIQVARSLGFCARLDAEGNVLVYGEKLYTIPFRSKPSEMLFHSFDTRYHLDQPIQVKARPQPEEYFGVTVDGNARYLLEDGIVTHNSCSAIHAIETVVSGGKGIRKALILVKNAQLIKQFRNEIIYTCTNNKYSLEGDASTSLMWKQAKSIYSLYTYQTFFNEFKGHLERQVKEFSNSVVVIDEVHDLIHSTMYPFFDTFLHAIRNRKIILMTGTPMVNSASDIALLMNLILPRELELPTDRAFDDAFINPETGRIDSPEAIDLLESRVKGRVSYLTSQVNIPFTFRGQQVGDIAYPLTTNVMSEFQERSYRQALKIDNTDQKSSGFYIHSLDASLFVFPDGSYGTQGFQAHITKKRDVYVAPFLSEMRRMSKQDKLQYIYRHSSKYQNIIQSILNHPDQNVFVYMKSITGSGAIILGLLLEQFGFSRVSGTESTKLNKKARRYAILSGETGTQWDTIRTLFNQKRNATGDYIQVLIGGEQVKQGISFWSIQQIHIATPEWNFSNIDQAIARGIRIGSHRFLPPNTRVNIFLHASVPTSLDIISIDIYLYQLAQEKDKAIKSVEYILKVSAIDCALTYERNLVRNSSENNSRKCEYHDCLYFCRGVSFPYVSSNPIMDTYELFFEKEYRDRVVQLLQQVFLISTQFVLWDLLEALKNEFTLFQLVQTLSFIIENKVPFTDKHGFSAYLAEHNNIFFLVNHLHQQPLSIDAFYVQHLPLQLSEPETDPWLDKDLDVIETTQDMSRKTALITTLPFWVQELFIEYAVLAREKTVETPIVEWVLRHYDSFIETRPNGKVVSVFMPDIVRVFFKNKWGTEEKETRNLHELSVEEFQAILERGKGWLGTYKGKKNDFSIIDARNVVDLSDLKKRKGQHCSTRDQAQLELVVNELGIDPPESFTEREALSLIERKGIRLEAQDNVRRKGWTHSGKKPLCKQIEQWFVDNNLIIDI